MIQLEETIGILVVDDEDSIRRRCVRLLSRQSYHVVAVASGAHAVMDLSTGSDMDASRRAILKEATVPVGTVPIYQAVVETIQQEHQRIFGRSFNGPKFLKTLRAQYKAIIKKEKAISIGNLLGSNMFLC